MAVTMSLRKNFKKTEVLDLGMGLTIIKVEHEAEN
jgi:hypothetical protein